MNQINSTSNPLICETRKLLQKKYRKLNKKFLIEGEKLLEEALSENFSINYIFCSQKEIAQKYQNSILVSDSIMKSISDSVHPPSLIAVVSQKEYFFKLASSNNCLVLDRIQNPQNLGSIIRTALGADFLDIFLIHCADIFEEKCLRASMGATFHINLHFVTEEEVLQIMKDNGYQVVLGSMEGTNVFQCDFHKRVAVVFGNEGSGVSDNLKNSVGTVISIPMNQKLESLNVAVSAGIIMYAIKNNQKGR